MRMQIFPQIVISNMIHKSGRRRSHAMTASLLLHGALFGALFYAPYPDLPVVTPAPELMAISLAAYAPASVAQPAPAVMPKAKPAVTAPAVRKPVQSQPPLKAEPKAAPRPVTAAAPKAALPKTPEIKVPEAAPLSEAFASPLSRHVFPDASAELSPPPTPGITSSATPLAAVQKADPKGPDASVLGQIRAMIEAAITYPATARRLRVEGVVTLSFRLTQDGTVADAKVLHSSGSTVLDRKALQTLWDLSGDFPTLPSLMQLTVPITFSLSRS